VFKQLLSDNNEQIEQTDIVMLLTPHIVRTHELTAEDLAPIYIGTQQNIGLGGPPPLIAPLPNDAPAAAAGTGATPPSTSTPGAPPPGMPRPPVAAEPGAQPTGRPVPPGTFPVPTMPAPPAEQPPATAQPAGATGATTPPGATGAPPAGTPPETVPPVRDPSTIPAQPEPAAATATPAQVIVTVPGTAFQIAGGPYTVPVSINNANRVSVITLTVTFNPNVLRVRTVQDGTFMRQGGVGASFTPRIDAPTGRVDIAITRTGDQIGASGAGLLAALLFDAVGPGSSMIQVTGIATTPEGAPIALQVSPVTVTVR
jgi:hypothetical protein